MLFLGVQAYVAYSTITNFGNSFARPTIMDWQGNPCDSGGNAGKPVLFWCYDYRTLKDMKPRDEGEANYSDDLKSYHKTLTEKVFTHPICVEDCPTEYSTSHECPNIWANESASYVRLPDYPTDSIDGFCLPRVAAYTRYMLNHVDRFVVDTTGDGPKVINELVRQSSYKNIVNAWPVIAGVGVGLSVAVSWAYLHFLDCCATFLVKGSAQLAVAAPLCVGLYFIRCATTGQDSGFSTGVLGSAGDLGRGICLVSLASVLFVAVLRAWQSLKTAAAVVQAGCECVFDEWSVMFEPFISSIARVVVLAGMGYPILFLYFRGRMERNPDNSWKVTLDPQQWEYLVFYVLVMLWAIEYINSSSQYVIAWVVKSWYFTPYEKGIKRRAPRFAIFQGIVNLMRYHLGTIAMGSLIISFLRPFRIVANLCLDLTVSNPVSACMSAACQCCILACGNYSMFLTKNTYIDVAIYSTPFREAARNAHIMTTGYFSNVFALNSVQCVFQIGGCGACAALGAVVSYAIVEYVPMYGDDQSPTYINDKSCVVYAAAIISLAVGMSFMVVFDIVTDTMFYCYVIDEHYLEEENEKYNSTDDYDWNSLWKFMRVMLLGEEDDEDEEVGNDGLPKRPVYAPDVLRDFMVANGVHAGGGKLSGEDREGIF
jgi:hypothetical protein